MNKTLSKAIMTRSRLRNKFLKDPSSSNRANYNKQRNFCVKLLRNTKRNYYNNLDLKLITDNKMFWKTIKPLFSDKTKACQKMTLVENESIVSDDDAIAETMNTFFSDVIAKLEIKEVDTEMVPDNIKEKVERAVFKFKKHPSVIKIKDKIQ